MRSTRPLFALLLAACLALLAGCGKPVPADRIAYVGDWQAPDMRLAISADGRVLYKRRKGSSTTSLDVPLQRFEGHNVVAGLGPMTTTFVVSAPPRLDDGVWSMTVDGVRLTRRPGQAPDAGTPDFDT